jgi:hypothetical protein
MGNLSRAKARHKHKIPKKLRPFILRLKRNLCPKTLLNPDITGTPDGSTNQASTGTSWIGHFSIENGPAGTEEK